MFVYYVEDEKKQEYLKKIKEESKSLNYESQKFLEIAFCDEDYNKQEDNSSSDSSEEIEKEFLKDDSDNKSSSDVEDENTIAEDTVDDEKDSSEYDDSNYRNSPIDIIIKKLEDKEVWTLEDIFPKKIYPALDLMMGKDLREIFISACEKIVQFPYTVGYYRKMIRSTNYRNHLNNIWNILKELVCQTVLGFDVIKLLKKDFDQDRYYNSLSSEQLAIEIDRKQ